VRKEKKQTMKHKQFVLRLMAVAMVLAAPAYAAFPADPVTKCAPDAVLAGSVWVDKYEASVWRIPALNPSGRSNKGLITKVRKGKATAADLSAGGATPLGVAGDDYTPCTDNGQNCKDDIYAVSLVGVTPSAYITWFQAQEAYTNAGKRQQTARRTPGATTARRTATRAASCQRWRRARAAAACRRAAPTTWWATCMSGSRTGCLFPRRALGADGKGFDRLV
jgi:hypothetical protein